MSTQDTTEQPDHDMNQPDQASELGRDYFHVEDVES